MQDPIILQQNHHQFRTHSSLIIPISTGVLSRRHYYYNSSNHNNSNNILLLSRSRTESIKCVAPAKGNLDYHEEEDEDEDLEPCPVECVRVFEKDDEFLKILEKAKEDGSLVVVDFYRTSCGSCKYIEQIFSKMCKGAGEQQAPIIFLKHNVIDEYDEQSEVAERLRIKSVPLFHFYKDGVLLEAFPTRDKKRILDAIVKYSNSPLPL
ncbi:thioredoxin-like 4, chloroplastic [Impatiens glandulifera]|uniref:thioredoxin-like 4, chloroplastic n=1 Tax=Impatiens glandulifera TaxID=253017 RepID=UPI001FB0D8C4|nr:thioredoxin-like 4, chloroplastic [Impatiens glandulifera]